MRGVQRAFDNWESLMIPIVNRALSEYRDSWTDDLTREGEHEWEMAVIVLLALVRRVLVQVNFRQSEWWFGVVARLTGQPVTVIRSLAAERWLPGQIDAQHNQMSAWLRGLGPAMVANILHSMGEGLRAGENRPRIIERAQTVVENARNRSMLSAASQVFAFGSILNQLRQQEAGGGFYIWERTISRRPRKEHLARVGSVYRWDQSPPDGPPGTQPHCKCGARPVPPAVLYTLPVLERYRVVN